MAYADLGAMALRGVSCVYRQLVRESANLRYSPLDSRFERGV